MYVAWGLLTISCCQVTGSEDIAALAVLVQFLPNKTWVTEGSSIFLSFFEDCITGMAAHNVGSGLSNAANNVREGVYNAASGAANTAG